MNRPAAGARAHVWKAEDKTETPGIALWGRRGLVAHMTYNEARRMADRLHDLADRLEAEQEPAPAPDGTERRTT